MIMSFHRDQQFLDKIHSLQDGQLPQNTLSLRLPTKSADSETSAMIYEGEQSSCNNLEIP